MADPLSIFDGFSAIVGTTGAGKSYTARGVVERFLHEQRRTCIVDPTGVWWGLRTMSDGGPGFPVVIFGGDHADVPITADAGGLLGALIGQGKVGASIVDVSEFGTGRRTQFLTDFFEALYSSNRAPLHLVLDEADEMAPQSSLPEAKRMVGAVDRIVRRGRVRGFRPMMITQRPAVIHKNVLSQISTLVAMKVMAPQDRAAITDWVKGNADTAAAREVMDSLSKLQRGEAWVWSPAAGVLERRMSPEIATFDSMRTPEHGAAAATFPPIAKVEVEALRAELAAAAKPAAKPTPKGKAAPTPEAIQAAERRGYERGFTEGRAFAAQSIAESAKSLRLILSSAPDALDRAIEDIGRAVPVGSDAPPPRRRSLLTEKTGPAYTHAMADIPGQAAPTTLNSAARKMLAVLDTKPPVRRSWQQVATLAGLKARGGHFNAGRKALVEQRLVDETNGLVAILTPSATARTLAIEPAAVVEMWAGVLSGAAPKVLRALFDLGGRCERGFVAANLGMQPRGGHWNAAWKELRDNGIVTVEGDVATLTELFQPGDAQ